MSAAAAVPDAPLVSPGRGAGLLDVFRNRYLLTLLVRKELRVRYRGSVLGLFWSYVKPAVQFAVFYFALGVFLRLNKTLDDYAVYLFSGIVAINYFSEILGNATRSVVNNAPLVKKIYLPRELFPVASLFVALVHLLPQVLILLVGALLSGWLPTPGAFLAAVLGVAVVTVLALGLGLIFAAVNVYFRDSENLVDLLLLVATWTAPVLYPWTAVQNALGPVLTQLYLANPLAIAVSLFHRAFWWDGTVRDASDLPPDLFARGLAALALSLGILALGQWVFRRLEGRFAQEL